MKNTQTITVMGTEVILNPVTRTWTLPGYEGWRKKLFPEKKANRIYKYLTKEGFMQNGDKFRLVHTSL